MVKNKLFQLATKQAGVETAGGVADGPSLIIFGFEDIVAPQRAAEVPAPAALSGMLLAFAAAIDTHPDHTRVWLDWSTAVRAGYWPAYLEFHARAMAVVGRMIERGKREGSLHDRLRTADEARVVIGLAHLIAHMKFAGNDARTIARTVRSLVDGYLTRPPGAG